ncbi:MAG: hypothetical protein Q9166_006421 [cf. Caloplaca sp. 2 TL-2023]
MDVTAGIITIVTSACTLAGDIKRLIEHIKYQDENAEELAHKVETLSTILGKADSLYGLDESRSYTPPEQQLRQAIKKVLVRYNNDIQRFKAKLEKLVRRGNWASVAWKQQTAAPALATVERSLSGRQHDLESLVQLLQGLQMHRIEEIQIQMIGMLRTLTNTSTNDIRSSTTGGDAVADTDSLILRVTTTLIADAESVEGQEDGESNANGILIGEEDSASHEDLEFNTNGTMLLEAIADGDHDNFNSLLLDGETSLKVMDAQDRTPLLLAAHLDNVIMVKMLLSNIAGADHNACSTTVTSILSPDNDTHANNTETTSHRDHREIHLNATDCLGRTVLHYCAEFGMCEEASILLDHGININARDNSDLPPVYYAIKNRKYFAVELLLAKGAATDFDRPTPTSREIEELLEKAPNNGESTGVPTNSP